MSKYLLNVTEVYRVDTESEAIKFIDEARQDNRFTLKKHSSVYRERKQKGEVVDSWYRLTLTKAWDDEKEPCGATKVSYGVSCAWDGAEGEG